VTHGWQIKTWGEAISSRYGNVPDVLLSSVESLPGQSSSSFSNISETLPISKAVKMMLLMVMLSSNATRKTLVTDHNLPTLL
ncbi:MAG: hypothetical protein LH679_04300, partial [Cyanobacteria bacterium CAN_BIN43]|nr:hypothetical protein [Cyanobacteria bacterium CAN_BIN43]